MTLAISCPPGSPENTHMLGPNSSWVCRVSHISRGPSPGKMSDVID